MALPDWICSKDGCGAVNAGQAERCENCGAQAPRQAAVVGPTAKPQGGVCPFDGVPLHANGWCPAGDGWPITRVVCPMVCDRCRNPLTWAGTCNSCTEYAPGDRYEYTDKDPHWRMVEKGPFVILSRQQQAHRAAEFGEVMARLATKGADRVHPAKALRAGDQTEDMPDRAAKGHAMLAAFHAHNAWQEVTR